MAAADDLALLIQSRYPLIAAETVEEHRFQRTLLQVAESLRVPFYEWSLTEGLHRIPALGAVYDTTEPLKALNKVAKALIERIRKERPLRVQLTDAELDTCVDRLRGMTAFEAERTLSQAIVRDNGLDKDDIEYIVSIKKELLKRDGLLEYIAPEENLAQVGGFATLKAWLAKRKRAFEPAAREFGLEFPKGILLLGVQGAGKTLVAKAVAREWGLPLLKMEPGRLYDKYIGESDKNLEKALHMAEAMAPCVLMIDEIEKGLS